MAHIAPFRGIIYNSRIINNFSQVVTPPYDVINPEEQERFYQLHPNNIIRLDFGKTFPGDTPEDNRYTRAARTLKTWVKDQLLIQDQEPAIYLYKIHFSIPGQGIRIRTGFISLLGLEPFDSGKVRPHEKTFSSFKQDRYQLFQHCQMQFCPIFSFYIDPEDRILSLLDDQAADEPFIDFVDQDSIRHQLWRITAPSTLIKIRERFLDKTVYIADGHHRYETSLAYQSDMRREHPELGKTAAFNYTLMFLCPMEDPGLTIFPVHRALNRVSEIDPLLLEKKLDQYFTVEKIPFDPENKEQRYPGISFPAGEKTRHRIPRFWSLPIPDFLVLSFNPQERVFGWRLGERSPPFITTTGCGDLKPFGLSKNSGNPTGRIRPGKNNRISA